MMHVWLSARMNQSQLVEVIVSYIPRSVSEDRCSTLWCSQITTKCVLISPNDVVAFTFQVLTAVDVCLHEVKISGNQKVGSSEFYKLLRVGRPCSS
jgi:hypothetical protein